ncbi:hypothetical protein PybrP1_011423 [[Pythium] brassicae (nom. inval.)]|nr:hypothetical protein PybrP1_011423 [[Pythium] brassicae (nom. inval.)]
MAMTVRHYLANIYTASAITLSSKKNLLRVTNAFSCTVELLVLLAAAKLRREMSYIRVR